jgi:hypothetical protein
VVEFEPRIPFWAKELEDLLEDPADQFFPAPDFPEAPDPLEHCWISWPDLDNPAQVVQQIDAAFARATRRTGVHQLDPRRVRRKPADSAPPIA